MMMIVAVMMRVTMCIMMMVIVHTTKNHRASCVHDETYCGDNHRLLIMDYPRLRQTSKGVV